MRKVKQCLSERPWLLVVAAFMFLIFAWTVLIFIARKNAPDEIPVTSQVVDAE